MKRLVFYLLLYGFSTLGWAQDIDSFITAYNNHIVPSGVMDTIEYISVTKRLSLQTLSGHSSVSTMRCTYYADGKEECIDSLTNSESKINEFLPLKTKGLETIQYELGFIKRDETSSYEWIPGEPGTLVLQKNDTVKNSTTTYTFNAETLHLKEQVQRSHQLALFGTRRLLYTDYICINSVYIAQKIHYVNDQVLATLECAQIRIE